MPKNVTFREDAVVLMHEKQSALGEIKNFFASKFNGKDKVKKESKSKDSVHSLIKKSSALFEDKKNDPITRLSKPSAMFAKTRNPDQSLFQQLLRDS
jgi:hypothetical protein